MKILISTGIFPPDIGGPATYVAKLAKEFQRKGIETKVICYSDIKKYGNYAFPVIRISRKYLKGIRHFLYFRSLLGLAKDVDVIYSQNAVSAGLPSILVSKILRRKMVLKIVGDYAWERARSKWGIVDEIEEFQKKKYNQKIENLRRIQKFVAKNANKIITPSEYLKNIILNWGVPQEKIEVIYNATEKLLNFNISKEGAKKKTGIRGDIILSVGRLVPWKGFSTLINLFPDLIKRNPNFCLVIIGEGPEKENLKSEIKSLKLENKIRLMGKVAHPQIGLYYKAADIFVLNSGYEGLPHVVLEAMQFGVPIIVSNKGGNPELIQDGFNGILVEYNNKEQLRGAILKLWRNKTLQEQFIQNSYSKLKIFSWENLVEKTLRILRDPISQGDRISKY